MLGIKSRNVWVMDIETMKTTRIIAGTPAKVPSVATRIEEIRFMCIPGERPVNVPNIIPSRSASVNSISM